jgi:chromosome segregation ATPase
MYEYDYDAEAEIEKLQHEIKREEVRTKECQREIARLRSALHEVRKYCASEERLESLTAENLFDIWADFGDEESPESVSKVLNARKLGPSDTISFIAYCAGFYKALQIFKED